MLGNAKIIGPILIIGGLVYCLVVGALMFTVYSIERVTPDGAILGAVACGFLPMLISVGIGTFLFFTGRKEEADLEVIRKKERILGLIQTQGQASVSSIMMEMDLNRQQVTDAIYELVAMGLFSGYVDWDSATFYSQDASAVGSNQCPNCGGVRELVGKGVIKCPYCGVSLFIPPDAEQKTAAPVPPPDWEG